ncbi:MAG: hypothetical protein IPG82_09520 [Saprospiraceae bacterium]|nr:hypothetical protein [Saprospiraceae bacterium]
MKRYELKPIVSSSWWRMYAPDPIHGGFAGEIDQHNMPKVDADKGSVLHARILWTFQQLIENLAMPKISSWPGKHSIIW